MRANIHSIATAAMFFFCCVACDSWTIITHKYMIPDKIDLHCIQRAAGEVPGAARLTLTSPPTIGLDFVEYLLQRDEQAIGITLTTGDSMMLVLSANWGGSVSRREINATRELILDAKAALESTCRLAGSDIVIEEVCGSRSCRSEAGFQGGLAPTNATVNNMDRH